MYADFVLRFVKRARLLHRALGLLVAKRVQQLNELRFQQSLARAQLEGSRVDPAGLRQPLAFEPQSDLARELEIMGDEQRGKIEERDTEKGERGEGNFEAKARIAPPGPTFLAQVGLL